jgi:hypothetical protein
MGRVEQDDSAKIFYWSGTATTMNFDGTNVSATLKDETGNNYFNVILDDSVIAILKPDTIKKSYLLAENLPTGKHSIRLFKRTEFAHGKTWFYGFGLKNGDVLPSDPEKKKRIEFFGNSITAGYAIEDLSGGDSPDSTNTNNYLTYANLTAQYFDTDYKCICRSGIGIMISWIPIIMPEIYDLLDPLDSTSKWNYSSQSDPDVVVINLMQNDSWLVNLPDYETFKPRFGDTKPTEEEIVEAYQNFVMDIRDKYPDSSIICAMGSMDATQEDSKWPGYLETAVANMKDDKIYTHFFPFINTNGHPRVSHNQEMAQSLIGFIEENVEW